MNDFTDSLQRYIGSRIYVQLLQPEDAAALLDYKVRNAQFLKPFTPLHMQGQQDLTLERTRTSIELELEQAKLDTTYRFGIFMNDTEQLIGTISLSGIVRKAFQSCLLGYALSEEWNGRGLMTEAVQRVLDIAFRTLSLHRVQAAVMPHNVGSIRVLEKVGFRKEGYAPRYLSINGNWEDHIIFAILAEDYV